MQWAFIAMLVLLLSVTLNIFYFAAAVTANYSAAGADADMVSIFVVATIATSQFHCTSTHALPAAELLICFLLPVVASLSPVDCFFAVAGAQADTINTAVALPSLPINC